jgi:hypothetical protein
MKNVVYIRATHLALGLKPYLNLKKYKQLTFHTAYEGRTLEVHVIR